MAEAVALNKHVKSAKDLLSGITVVDADTHVSEWHDLWTSRAPANWKARMPQVKKSGSKLVWVIDGDTSLNKEGASSAIRKDGTKVRDMSFRNFTVDDVHPGCYDVKERIKYMDEQGIGAQIAYANLMGFGGQKSMMVDPALRLMCTQIFNDAMAEMQVDSNNRIYPMAMVPWWDIKLAVAEVERCAKMGARGINMNSDPHLHKLPHLGESYWDPLWEVCADKKLPVNFHIGASDESMSWYGAGLWPGHDSPAQLAYGSVMVFTANLRVLANIFMSRFLERHPNLKIVSVESGVGWIPFLLEALEYQIHEAGLDFKMTPTEIFQRQIYACSWFERKDYAHKVRQIGVENVLFETDFPHPTCLYPDSLDWMTGALAEMTGDERKKVFGGNAEKLYNLDLSAVRLN